MHRLLTPPTPTPPPTPPPTNYERIIEYLDAVVSYLDPVTYYFYNVVSYFYNVISYYHSLFVTDPTPEVCIYAKDLLETIELIQFSLFPKQTPVYQPNTRNCREWNHWKTSEILLFAWFKVVYLLNLTLIVPYPLNDLIEEIQKTRKIIPQPREAIKQHELYEKNYEYRFQECCWLKCDNQIWHVPDNNIKWIAQNYACTYHLPLIKKHTTNYKKNGRFQQNDLPIHDVEHRTLVVLFHHLSGAIMYECVDSGHIQYYLQNSNTLNMHNSTILQDSLVRLQANIGTGIPWRYNTRMYQINWLLRHNRYTLCDLHYRLDRYKSNLALPLITRIINKSYELREEEIITVVGRVCSIVIVVFAICIFYVYYK